MKTTASPDASQPRTRTGWVNLFPDDLTGCVHASGVFDTEDRARRAGGETCIATVPVSWQERAR